jgi:hypothetical protein
MLEDLQRQSPTGRLYLRLFLVLVILASCGMLSVYIVSQADEAGFDLTGQLEQFVSETKRDVADTVAPEPGVNLKGVPHTSNVAPRRFALWELHANDTVRLVEVITDPGDKGSQTWAIGPSLRSGDKVLSGQIIGGELLQKDTYEEVYLGRTYLRPRYKLKVSHNTFGYDMRVNHPPHLHINGDDRLISIGVDPKSYAQEIIAIAIPVEARITGIYDHQPYRHITLGQWDVFYYDTSKISGHVSIHINYHPASDAPSLNWTTVEASR